ncbi:glycosyltransferase [Thiomicrorhabdus sp.]|uniref:glycosyltransferase n=1 Tax=Thiomicrorhabdus sp. TaxID=2039724 RepID=UPI0029C60EE1|nr:glycosyltransferase [Thiomicrorhabdus sp.]
MKYKVSILVPIYNASKYLDGMIQQLKFFIGNDNVDVLWIDSSSTDDSISLIQDSGVGQVVGIRSTDFDHGGTRSKARELCNGEVIVFLTQDALPLSTDDVMKLVSVFDDESIGAAYGRQIAYEHTSLFGKHLREFNYSKNSYIRELHDKEKFGIKTAFLSNSFAAYRRSAMDQIGWFKDGLILGEDTYAGAKLLKFGYKLAYVAEAQVYHSHSYTVWEEFKRYFDIGVFHQMEHWILDEFGTPEGEGGRYIKSEFKYLLDRNAYHLIPQFFVRNAMKLIGYKFGKIYSKLPNNLVKKFSMHRRWWDKQELK